MGIKNYRNSVRYDLEENKMLHVQVDSIMENFSTVKSSETIASSQRRKTSSQTIERKFNPCLSGHIENPQIVSKKKSRCDLNDYDKSSSYTGDYEKNCNPGYSSRLNSNQNGNNTSQAKGSNYGGAYYS